jgi:hypothetical protein
MVRTGAFLVPLTALLMAVDPAWADPAAVPGGAYEIVSRLELPHLERWALDHTTRVCLSGAPRAEAIPIPVLSDNNPFARCAAANLVVNGASIEYDIVCPGRASAKAHASYMLEQDGFAGRVAMVMAAKNMTMTEVVRARRVGGCEPQHHDGAGDPQASATAR